MAAPSFAAGELSLASAIALALNSNPNTLLRQQQVISAEGQVLQAQGSFDPVISANAGYANNLRPLREAEIATLQAAGLDPDSEQEERLTSYDVGADKRLPNGMSVGAGYAVTSTTDSLETATDVPSQLVGTLDFSLTVPLGRNAGRDSVGAEVEAAKTEVDAARAELHHGNAQIVLDTALAYWDWLATVRRLDISSAGERRLGDLINEMNRLIAADQMPRADVELALASRAEKTAQRLAAEQAVQDSRKRLARLLGLPAGRFFEIGRPTDDFPPYRPVDSVVSEADLIRNALDARADLEAIRYREEAARYRLTAARIDLKPQVDLDLILSYTGLAEDSEDWRADRGLEDITGPSFGATVSLLLPWNNSAARGTQRSAAATYDSATITLRDLQENIATSVPVAATALRRAVAQGIEVARAVKHYETALKNERTKRRLGNSTVIDVINVEDRLNDALLGEVAQRQNYANAVAQLRFELGSLIRHEGEEYRVLLNALLTGDAYSE